MTEPPSPPSPPAGPPRGTLSSRRMALDPMPPSPAFTWIVASSMNCTARADLARNNLLPRDGMRQRAHGRIPGGLGTGRGGGGCPARAAGLGRRGDRVGGAVRRERDAAVGADPRRAAVVAVRRGADVHV